MMSPTFIGFVFLLGILHVCSGESVNIHNLVDFSPFFQIWVLQVKF